MTLALEDAFEDIISKSQAGLKMSLTELSEKTGVSTKEIQSVKGGQFNESVIRMIAPTLNLNPDRLVAIAQNRYTPNAPIIDGLKMYSTPFHISSHGDMIVNAYLIYDNSSKDAIAFDTGANVTAMLAFIKEQRLNLKSILLTHAHPDHIHALNTLKEATGNPPVYIHRNESLPAVESIDEGKRFRWSSMTIETFLTSGHSPGGCTYKIEGLSQPIAIVGDAIFAGSMGGAINDWEGALTNIKSKILNQPDHTLICPGHGPLTTVGLEKKHNPIFDEN